MPSSFIEFLSEPQKKFFLAQTRFTAYGGARGGGKSWAVRKKAVMLAVQNAGIKILILRRSYPELRENHILPLKSELAGIAAYSELEKTFLFAGGSRIKFGYCARENDVLQYQGQEYDVIFIDEATHFTEWQFAALAVCIRGANKFPKRMYLTCNPGGVGHGWVKRLFIDKQYKKGENPQNYSFIAAKVYDNLPLMQNDSGYIEMLKALPENRKKAWLDGDWNIFEGQFLKEWQAEVHVVKPFLLPTAWKRYFSMDYGLDMFAGIFTAVSPEGKSYVYKEIYKPDLVISRAAGEIKAAMEPGEKIECFFAPPDLWNRRQESGLSAAELFMNEGIPLVKAPNSRPNGWMALKEMLKVTKDDETQQKDAQLKVFENCENLIRTLPQLCYKSGSYADASTQPHEITHAPDALRYYCAAYSAAPTLPQHVAEEEKDSYTSQIDRLWNYKD